VYKVGATPTQYKLEQVILGHTAPVRYVEYYDNTHVVTVGQDGMIRTWALDAPSTTPLSKFQHSAGIRDAQLIVEGGNRLDHGDLAHGHFVAPAIARAPLDHPLWQRELFLPFALVAPVESIDEGIAQANASDLGLTAGFYGAPEEAERFFATIEAGVTYANRPQGATTGAWPGYQPFGGWKGSGSTGKSAGSRHYLPQYLREQSQTRVRRDA